MKPVSTRIAAVQEGERAPGEVRPTDGEPGDQSSEGGALAEGRHEGSQSEHGPPQRVPSLVLVEQLDRHPAGDERKEHHDQGDVERRKGHAEHQWHAGPPGQGQHHQPRLVAIPQPRHQGVHLPTPFDVAVEQSQHPDAEVVAIQNDVGGEEDGGEEHPNVGQAHGLLLSALMACSYRPAGATSGSAYGGMDGVGSGWLSGSPGPCRTTRATYQT